MLRELVSPSGMVETPRLQAKFLFCDRVNNPQPPSPLRGEGWDGDDKGIFFVHPHPYPPPSPQGEGILGRVKSAWVWKRLAFKARVV
jgi:hypothetical protein